MSAIDTKKTHQDRLEQLEELEHGTIISFRSDHEGNGSQIYLATKILGYVYSHGVVYEQWTNGAPKCSQDEDNIHSEPGFDEDFLADQDYTILSVPGDHSFAATSDLIEAPLGSLINGFDMDDKLIWGFKVPLTWDSATGDVLTSGWANSFGEVKAESLESIHLHRGSFGS